MRASLIDANVGILADVDAAIAASPGLRLTGAAWRESNAVAAAATFTIKHSATGNGGTVVLPVELAANESGFIVFPDGGVACPDGVSIDVAAGTVDVILFYVTD